MTKTNLTATIDALGALKAQIADLEKKEKALKDSLLDLDPGAYEGEFFRLSISVADRGNLDMKAVREKLSPQFIAAHTTTKSVRTLKVSARNGNGIEE
jgi:hypothetical protein